MIAIYMLISCICIGSLGFPGGSVVKNLAANAGVLSLDWEDPPEKEMTTHSSILP